MLPLSDDISLEKQSWEPGKVLSVFMGQGVSPSHIAGKRFVASLVIQNLFQNKEMLLIQICNLKFADV